MLLAGLATLLSRSPGHAALAQQSLSMGYQCSAGTLTDLKLTANAGIGDNRPLVPVSGGGVNIGGDSVTLSATTTSWSVQITGPAGAFGISLFFFVSRARRKPTLTSE